MSLTNVLILVLHLSSTLALDNGLARTPPMGFMSWERFRIITDCVNYPDDCLSEKLFKVMADRMVSDGYKDAGYEYVIIDEGWSSYSRDKDGRMQSDPLRFPSGMRALADYIHGKGLKVGIYSDFGTTTCDGPFPGSEYYYQLDAQTFADWTYDLVKLDGCYAENINQFDTAFPMFEMWLNRTGRPMLFSCGWPLYQESSGRKPNYKLIAETCNTWYNTGNVDDSWDSVATIIEHYGQDATGFIEVVGPGAWNDPDELVIGDFGLSYDQQQTQMALWCIFAAPLIMSVDLRAIRPESRAILLNKQAIAINQDVLGIMGRRIIKNGNLQIWTRPILPKNSYAIAVMSTYTPFPYIYSFLISAMNMTNPAGYNVTDVFSGTYVGIYKPSDTFKVKVNPGGVFFGRANAL